MELAIFPPRSGMGDRGMQAGLVTIILKHGLKEGEVRLKQL